MWCNDGSLLASHDGFWGHWKDRPYCPEGYTGIKVRTELPCGDCDDTALNEVQLFCPLISSWQISGHGSWGVWREQHCPRGKKICGVNTRIERKQGRGDDTAMNGILVNCC